MTLNQNKLYQQNNSILSQEMNNEYLNYNQ